VAHASTRLVHSPSVDAWAVLDGGVTAIYGYGLTTLPRGVRVIGFGAFRLLVAELALTAPQEPFPGEPLPCLDELRIRHHGASPLEASAVEQAELLASCTEALLLRWVASTLLAESDRAEA
jgi:hypothetical protein